MLLVNSHVVVFVVSNCVTLYFDSHYHSYVIILTPKQLLMTIDKLYDFNVDHAYKLSDGLNYISLKYHIELN